MKFASLLRSRLLLLLALSLSATLQISAAPIDGLKIVTAEGSEPGPTVFALIGLDGNRNAYAPDLAREFSEWPVLKGKLIFAVVSDKARKTGDPDVKMTTAFPSKGKREKPVGKTAEALWEIASEADYLLDFREARNSRKTSAKAYGQTIIAVKDAADIADGIAHAMNYPISNPDLHMTRITGGPANMLARASNEFFKTKGMSVYLSGNLLTAPERANFIKHGIYRLLDRNRMIDPDNPIFNSINPKPRLPDYRNMHPDKKLIGIFMGNGSSEGGIANSSATFNQIENVKVIRFTSDEVRDGILDQFDMVIFSGGSGGGQARALGDDGRAKVAEFVRNGGGYIGICAGAYLALSGQSYGLDLINAKTVSPKWRRGGAVLPVELSDSGTDWFSGKRTVNIRYNQGPIFEPDNHPNLPEYEVLAWFRGEVAKNNTPVGIQINSPAIAAATCGEGKVVIISPHPESTKEEDLGYFLTKSAARIFGETDSQN